MRSFYSWVVIMALSVLGGAAGLYFGGIEQLWKADISKLSFIILGAFIVYSAKTGREIFKCCKCDFCAPDVDAEVENGWFVADALTALGFLGTIVGLVWSLTAFDIDPTKMQHSMGEMIIGLSTAFYTTGCGLITSLILKLQINILGRLLERRCRK